MSPNLEQYFSTFRNNIVGIDASFDSPFGTQKIIYADWIASGRLYAPLEDKIKNLFGPMVGNTHSEASETGISMTHAYHMAQHIIKRHVNACTDDVLLSVGPGMTSAISKFHRILGLRVPDMLQEKCSLNTPTKQKCWHLKEEDRPVVFVTHMEHHSNHTSWLETIADVVVLEPGPDMLVQPAQLRRELQKYADRYYKYGSFTACSNVTGIATPYHELAAIMHEFGGYCFVDFAASAPYVTINMHPANPAEALDAIFFSPHKFLGGPGSAGMLIFNSKLYHNEVPDQPGGGTVEWTDRWGRKRYISDIEVREDGGTPGFLQTIRAALAIKIKDEMGVEQMHERERQLITRAQQVLEQIPTLHMLHGPNIPYIGVFSFYVEGVHHNLMVKLLNDRYGIQVRGGCSCAGTYGHYLLDVTKEMSERITVKIDAGDASEKPGWVRLSLHPTMTNAELEYVLQSIQQVVENASAWKEDYYLDRRMNEWFHRDVPRRQMNDFEPWFQF